MGGYDQAVHLGMAALGPVGFACIAPSRPGYLGTSLALGATPEQQADVYAALLDALAIPQASVIAVSGGGQSALQFALRHPARCRALVMISACSAAITEPVPFRFRLMTFLARIPALADAMRRRAAKVPQASVCRAIPDPVLRVQTLNDPESGPLLRANLASITDRIPDRLPGTRNDIAQARVHFHYPFHEIHILALVIHGTADQAVPFAHAEHLAAELPHGELLAIPGGTHVSLFTHRALIQPRVRTFLESHI